MTFQVKRSLLSGDGRILEKNDQTPVTVADFGVQALISLGKFYRFSTVIIFSIYWFALSNLILCYKLWLDLFHGKI